MNEPTGLIIAWIENLNKFDTSEFHEIKLSARRDSVKEFEEFTSEALLETIPSKNSKSSLDERVITIVDELFFHSFYMVNWQEVKNAIAE